MPEGLQQIASPLRRQDKKRSVNPFVCKKGGLVTQTRLDALTDYNLIHVREPTEPTGYQKQKAVQILDLF